MAYNVMAVVVNHRSKNSTEIQKVFTEYGCLIKMRLGLHEAGSVCSEDGLIILQLDGERAEIECLRDALNDIGGVSAKNMEV